MKLAQAAGKEDILEAKTKVENLDPTRHLSMPHIDQEDPNCEQHCAVADHIEKTNPSLYKKMMSWG